ncbi:MAG: SoxR reducing system RseC family protein [Bacteroidota bacterium]|nr:SoxR reducing system RseC family protein [Bacteroidota bacterium]
MTIAQHNGVVTAVDKGQVTVCIESHSACSSCEAHGKCGFAESKAKEIDIKTNYWQDYHVGENVTVGINKSLGLQAVALAYILPAVLMIAIFIILNKYVGDLWSAVATIAFVAIYWGILALFRNRLQNRFTFHLEHTFNDELQKK